MYQIIDNLSKNCYYKDLYFTLGYDIQKPYIDFSGSGEIISFGKPILNDDNQLLGAVMIDSAVLTNKKRIGPYFDSEFFDGRFKSYLIIIDFGKDLVISHPEIKTEFIEGNVLNNNRINSYFTLEQQQMIRGYVILT